MMNLSKVAAKFKSGNKTLTSKKTKGKFDKVMRDIRNRGVKNRPEMTPRKMMMR